MMGEDNETDEDEYMGNDELEELRSKLGKAGLGGCMSSSCGDTACD